MDIKTCRNCGKIFQYRGSYICPDCTHKMDEQFVKVRNYMYQNPKASIDEICDENDVTADMVMAWLREGRLMVSDSSMPLLKCTSCGKPITAGRLCPACTSGFVSKVSNASRDIEKSIHEQKEAADKRGYHTGHF